MIIDILASTGVVGLLLYSSMFIRGYRESTKLIKKDMSVIIPFAIFTASLAIGIGENVLRGRFVWMSIALILVLKRLFEKEQSEFLSGKEKSK